METVVGSICLYRLLGNMINIVLNICIFIFIFLESLNIATMISLKSLNIVIRDNLKDINQKELFVKHEQAPTAAKLEGVWFFVDFKYIFYENRYFWQT